MPDLSICRLSVLVLVAACLAGCATRELAPRRTCFHSEEADEKAIGYCEAVRSGNLLYISGNVGKGEMSSALRQAYDGIRRTLAANGLAFRDVVKETIFATDLDALIRAKEVRKEYYGPDLPAATWVQVQRLYSPAAVIEVEVTAEYSAR